MAQIVLNIPDEILADVAGMVKRLDDDATVIDPLKFVTLMLQKEVDNLEVYFDYVFDAGGNSIGDVMEQKEMLGVVEVNLD